MLINMKVELVVVFLMAMRIDSAPKKNQKPKKYDLFFGNNRQNPPTNSPYNIKYYTRSIVGGGKLSKRFFLNYIIF